MKIVGVGIQKQEKHMYNSSMEITGLMNIKPKKVELNHQYDKSGCPQDDYFRFG